MYTYMYLYKYSGTPLQGAPSNKKKDIPCRGVPLYMVVFAHYCTAASTHVYRLLH